jgi:hypothetical protein
MTLLLTVAALPWVLSVALRVYCGRIDRDFTPQASVIVFPILSMITAFSIAASMVAVAAVLLASEDGLSITLGVVILGWVAWRLAVVAAHGRRIWVSARTAARFGAEAETRGGTVIVDSAEPDAFAVPSGGSAVVITTALADALSTSELDAVIEHERAHIRFRHSFWTQMGEIAAQFDPLLRPVVHQIRHAAERHADETAAVHGRPATMSAVARTALLRTHSARRTTTLASTGGDVVRRVRALNGPPPAPQRRLTVAMALVLILSFSVISVALFDVAQDVVAPEAGENATSVFR